MSTRAQRVRDRVMSGAYDWIIFPAALAFVVLIAFGLWKEYLPKRARSMEKLQACEQAADYSKGSKEHLIGCLLGTVDYHAPKQ
jgi:hypothetical protein